MTDTKAERKLGFEEWLRLACQDDVMKLHLVSLGTLIVVTFMLALWIGAWGQLLFCGVVSGFIMALFWRCQKELKNPPWYLQEAIQEAIEDERE